jgi:hypothetical protein
MTIQETFLKLIAKHVVGYSNRDAQIIRYDDGTQWPEGNFPEYHNWESYKNSEGTNPVEFFEDSYCDASGVVLLNKRFAGIVNGVPEGQNRDFFISSRKIEETLLALDLQAQGWGKGEYGQPSHGAHWRRFKVLAEDNARTEVFLVFDTDYSNNGGNDPLCWNSVLFIGSEKDSDKFINEYFWPSMAEN